MAARNLQQGLTLIEFMFALTVAALVLGALNGVVDLALKARAAGRQDNELVYQGYFALTRILNTARATAPKPLNPPVLAKSTGDWFSPTMYCLNDAGQLLERAFSEISCDGTKVLAENIIAFSAESAASSPTDAPIAVFELTVQSGGVPVVLSTSVRLRGGM
jgi:prepilin-type N-terminal cleavage/methylation domain-containing protein